MKAIKENWKLVLIVAAGIIAVIFMCIFGGGVIAMVKVRDILPLIQWNDAQIIKDQDEEICLLRNDFMLGSLSEEILNMTVTGIENDENIENTVVVYVTDKED